MKILLATSAAVPYGGGIASYNQELVKIYKDNNEFHLLTSSNEKGVEGFVSVECIYGKNIYDYGVANELIGRINAQKYDLIINSDSTFITIAAPFVNVPIISVAHFVSGILADKAGYNGQYNNAIVVLSNYCKSYLEKKFNIVDSDKIKVIYNFVQKKEYDANKIENDTVKIVYPGGTSVKKSSDVVMDVAYRLKRTNLNFSFYWLGPTLLPSANLSIFGIKDTRQMINDDPRFMITGLVPRDEAEKHIASANVFLLPSRGEGCPMTLLEAMRVGCIPVISDAHHGSFELIDSSKAGLIVKQGDSKATFDLLVDIILHHEKYKNFYNKSKALSETTLNPEVWKSQMDLLIKEALSFPKKSIVLDRNGYENSVRGYKQLVKQDRVLNMFESAKNRIKMDWLYFRWKVLK